MWQTDLCLAVTYFFCHLLQQQHNDTVSKLDFVLSLSELVINVARLRTSPLTSSSSSLTGDQLWRVEQLVLNLHALQLLASSMQLARCELESGRLQPSATVRNSTYCVHSLSLHLIHLPVQFLAPHFHMYCVLISESHWSKQCGMSVVPSLRSRWITQIWSLVSDIPRLIVSSMSSHQCFDTAGCTTRSFHLGNRAQTRVTPARCFIVFSLLQNVCCCD